MLLDLNDFNKVNGEIYIITNTITNKSYVGQTRSHRLNRKKYRPFGYLGRFKDHICESNSNKKNCCRYLNSSLVKYGSDKFICNLLLTCSLDELDNYETQKILEYNTKFPNGYNLTNGGQKIGCMKGNKIVLNNEPEPLIVKEKRCLKKSDYTKMLISEQLKISKGDELCRTEMMKISQKQHLSKKFERFKNVLIDPTKIEQYIHIIKNNNENYEYIRIVINNIKTTFVGKFETIQQIKERAIHFINELISSNVTKLRETTLEPSLPL